MEESHLLFNCRSRLPLIADNIHFFKKQYRAAEVYLSDLFINVFVIQRDQNLIYIIKWARRGKVLVRKMGRSISEFHKNSESSYWPLQLSKDINANFMRTYKRMSLLLHKYPRIVEALIYKHLLLHELKSSISNVIRLSLIL